MNTILIVEDDASQATALKKMISNLNKNSSVHCVNSYESAIELINSANTFSTFFLDISLEDISSNKNGMTLAKYIRTIPCYNYTPIIFITAYTNNILSAINDIHCLGYIVKPYTIDDVKKALEAIDNSHITTNKALLFKDSHGISFRLAPDDISYIESFGHTLRIVNSKCDFTIKNHSMKSILKKLPNQFIRCHKSYIINSNYIETYDQTLLIARVAGTDISIGRAYKNNIERIINTNE